MIDCINLDQLLDYLEEYRGGYFQKIVIEIQGEQYLLKDAFVTCDQVTDHANPDNKEEANHRIVLEV